MATALRALKEEWPARRSKYSAVDGLDIRQLSRHSNSFFGVPERLSLQFEFGKPMMANQSDVVGTSSHHIYTSPLKQLCSFL